MGEDRGGGYNYPVPVLDANTDDFTPSPLSLSQRFHSQCFVQDSDIASVILRALGEGIARRISPSTNRCPGKGNPTVLF
jgi:hypothetical protein